MALYFGLITYRHLFDMAGIPLRYNEVVEEARRGGEALAGYFHAVTPEGEIEPVYLTKRMRLLPGPRASLVRTEYDPGGCLTGSNPFGAFIDVSFETQTLDNAVVIFDYRSRGGDALRFYYRVAPDAPWRYRHKVALPASTGEVVFPVVPPQADARVEIAGLRIELPIRDEPYCLREVWLAAYSFGG